MKILLLTTHLEMGGIPIYVVSLATGLKRRGHTPIVASSGGWLEKRLAEEGIAHEKISCRTSIELNPVLWFRVFPKLFALIKKERPDLIHGHTRVTQVLAWALSRSTGVPYVTTCHGLYQRRLGRKLFRCWGEWVMAISQPTMERLVREYKLVPPHQVVLVRNGIEVDRFLAPPPAQEMAWFRETIGLKGKPVIGAIARLSPVKGFDTLLKSVPGLLKDFPNLQVLLVGDGPAREDLVRLAYDLKIADRVVIFHSMEDTRIPLAVMDLFAAPSLQEGFGLAIVEAMASGVPVVASNAGGPAEIIEENISGLLVPPNDPASLERAIRTLLADSERRRRIAEAARRRAKEQFDMERVIRSQLLSTFTHIAMLCYAMLAWLRA